VLYVSPARESISGYPLARLHQSPLAWIDFAHPDDRARVAGVIAENRGKGQFDTEYRVRHRNGNVRWLHAWMVEVRGPDGSVERIVGTATDITQRRELEEQRTPTCCKGTSVPTRRQPARPARSRSPRRGPPSSRRSCAMLFDDLRIE
jgi:PAS domain S-box-containing protein